MTDHRCDAQAVINSPDDARFNEPGADVRCELFLGHEGDHRVTLAWPDPVAAAEDAMWEDQRLDVGETFDVEVPIEKRDVETVTLVRPCGAQWDQELGETFICSLARGHSGPHLRTGDLRALVLGPQPCEALHFGNQRCTETGAHDMHRDRAGHLWR